MSRLADLSAVAARLAVYPLIRVSAKIGIDAIRVRYIWQALQPLDPLRHDTGGRLPTIDVLIPAHPKDAFALRYALSSAQAGSANPIRRFVVVTLDDAVAELGEKLPTGTEVVSESSVLGELGPWVREHVPPEARGWVIQQCIKILWVLGNDASATLVLDADTILLKPRTWLNERGVQALCVSVERHREYVRHSTRCWPVSEESQSVSYVTHHQLMQTRFLQEMFPDGAASLRRWVAHADFRQPSALSEYHSYGAWVRTFRKADAVCASFKNRGRLLDELLDDENREGAEGVRIALMARYPKLASLSFHSWRSVAS